MATIMTMEQMQAELARLQAENERLQKQSGKKTEGGLLLSEKRAISVYGIGRFPVSLHRGQWIQLFKILEVPVPPKLTAFFAKYEQALNEVEAERQARKASAKTEAAA